MVLAPSFLLTIGILIPFFVAIFYSFTDLTLRSPEYEMIGFKNFVDTFTNPDFWHSVGVTVRYAFFATAVEMVLGMIIALCSIRAPSRISPVGTDISLRSRRSSALIIAVTNQRLAFSAFRWGWIGLAFPMERGSDWALFSLVIIDVWIYTPFVVILVLAGLRSLPKAPYEAALIDGGSAWFVYKNLTLPMLAPVLLIALVFRMMTSLQEFGIIFATTKGGPGDRTLSVAVASYNEAFPYYNLSGAIPMLLFLWFLIYVVCFILIGFWRNAQKAASGAV
jgi:multiple sugar transport system permease protein